MSQLVKTKRQANFKDFKRFGAFKGLVKPKNVVFNSFERKFFNINIYSEKFTVVSTKIEYSTVRRVEYRIFFNIMSYRFVLILGSGIGISNVEISGIFESL
jgi:hypothetical protein